MRFGHGRKTRNGKNCISAKAEAEKCLKNGFLIPWKWGKSFKNGFPTPWKQKGRCFN